MNELWTPKPDKNPDVTNIFDMMMVFQEKLDSIEGRSAKIQEAHFAVRALASSLKSFDDEKRHITLVTGLAVIDSTEDVTKGAIAENVGMHGIVNDVHCINIGERLPLSVSIGMDVISVFPPESPDDTDLILSTAKAPINQVWYIRSAA